MKEKLIKNDPYNNQEIFEPSRPINNFAASYNSIISGRCLQSTSRKSPRIYIISKWQQAYWTY